jgi:hypothetical protein
MVGKRKDICYSLLVIREEEEGEEKSLVIGKEEEKAQSLVIGGEGEFEIWKKKR